MDVLRRMWRVGRWTLPAAVITMIAGSPAAMAARNTAVSQRASVPGQSVGSATANCRPGSAAVAAGFEAPGFVPNDADATVARISSRLVGRRQVKTEAFNFGTQAGGLVSFAYCRKAADPPQLRSDSTSVPPSTAGSAVAKCPPGSVAIGGGFEGRFSLLGAEAVIPLTSKLLGDRRWLVEGFNAGGASGDLVAHAYCKPGVDALVTRSEQTTAPGDHAKTFTVRCPDRSRAVAGGFDGHLGPGPSFTGSGAVSSKRADHRTSWQTSAVGVNAQPGMITAYVYCKT